jgi:hypothetical protein
MKAWWLALVLVGCASNNKEDIDATGTVAAQMTWGGGNCQKSGKEAFTIFLGRNAYGSYDITHTSTISDINGNVTCGPEYCEIQFWQQWTGMNYEYMTLEGVLTLDGDTMQITGNGKYSVSGSGTSCEQMVTYAGALQ